MKIDRNKSKKCTTEVPTDCRVLIEKLRVCSDEDLLKILQQTVTWTVGKCELFHWVEVLDRFDDILSSATCTGDSKWLLAVNTDMKLTNLTISVLNFTSLLIEYSFSRHSYSSVEHLISLLSSSNLDVILAVLNLLYVFSKRSNFLSRLADKQRLPLLKRLSFLAESWGGKENGFGLAESCLNRQVSGFPANATTLHYEFYADPKDINDSNSSRRVGNTNMFCIHVENVHEMSSCPADIMESLIHMYPVPHDSKMLLYTHLRLAHSFAQHQTRLKCVQARLHAISVLVYTNNVSDIGSILYSGFTEELVDILQVKDNTLVDIKAAALRTLTSIVHLDCRDRTPRLGAIVDVTGVSQYHGFLPVLVRRCIDSMTRTKQVQEEHPEFPHSFATALFSFLYHLSSYESGGEALVQSGMMGPLLSVVTNMGDQQEQTTFVTRAVRVIDLVTNIDWQAFQAVSGLQVFIDRLEHEVIICRKDAPPACDTLPGSSNNGSSDGDISMEVDAGKEDSSSNSAMETEDGAKQKVDYKHGAQCLPQRAALFKSVLNFLKKAISDQAFGEQVRHMMDGTLPNSLKHIIGNVEYYGPALFLLAMEVVTVYVFQEPSLLSTLQDNGLTQVMLHALLVKDPPATREVLASLPNIFSALCLNSRGLEAFVNCSPFDSLFRVMLSPEYLLAMRRRRSSDPLGDTASNLGNAMDELMRHQPTLRPATMKAIHGLLTELLTMGSDPATVCSKSSTSKTDVPGGTSEEEGGPGGDVPGENLSQVDENPNQDEAGSEDEVEEVEEVPATTSKSTSSTTQVLLTTGSKKHIPLLDYMQNVTKFIHAIVSNNTTDDHCREFRQHGGIPALLGMLRLPALPLDFPTSSACQSVTSLTQTVFLLLREPTVLTEGLRHVRDILDRLQPSFLVPSDDQSGPSRRGSVLLQELIQQKTEVPDREDVPLVRSLVHIHAFVTLFLNMPRANQNEIRTIILDEWGSQLGCEVLQGLNKLYRTLIWESTILLALRTPGAIPEGAGFGEKELSEFLSEESTSDEEDASSAGFPPSQSVAMETDNGEGVRVAGMKVKDFIKVNSALVARNKLIKPVLTVASNLVRSLAELFNLLVKLAVGKPIRQRYNRHISVPNAHSTAPSRPARALSRLLSTLLKDGLSWRAPLDVPSSKLRITFLICTVGFTIPMLFDERHMPYHLMLQYFVGTGAHSELFKCFKWALSCESVETKDSSSSSSAELPGSVDDFLDAWLMLLERLVNPRNILNSPHVIHERLPTLTSPDVPPPIKAPFSAVKFLIKTQKAALEALQHLWASGRLAKLSSRICDAVILILCHLIRGEQIARDKLKEENDEAKQKVKSNEKTTQGARALAEHYFEALASQRALISTAARTNQRAESSRSEAPSAAPAPAPTAPEPDPQVVQQLMDMGFPRESCLEALGVANTLEGATEWLLTHSSEEDQLIRAITMSLENTSPPPPVESGPPAEAEVENEPEVASGHQSEQEVKPEEEKAQEEEPEPPIPEESEEETKKKQELEALMKADEEEVNTLNQDHEEPLSASDIDEFAASIFEGSLQLVNQLPDTVYRVCDVIVVLMKRAGKGWSDDVFEKLVNQMKDKCEKLLESYSAGEPGIWFKDDETTDGLATQALLFALLFEEMKESCARILSETLLIPTLVNLLSRAASWVQENNINGHPTPKWYSPIILLVDMYERTRVALVCRQQLSEKYAGQKREWKWFDDRSGRWCNYSPANHKSIDDAYKAGSPNVRFTAGRRRYTINFHQLIQYNEESGNRRPIMPTYKSDDAKKKETEKKIPKPEGLPLDETMETDVAAIPPPPQVTLESLPSTSAEPYQYMQLNEEEIEMLVVSCTAFVCLPVDADTLHSCMRLLLRLTRTETEDGHKRAMLFAQLGGPSALLRLKNRHGFIGFASLATLLLRHIMEDFDTLKITMDKTIRNIATAGAGNSSCGVNSGSAGSREMHYVLRALAPAACQHPKLFSEACFENMRINLQVQSMRNVDAEDEPSNLPEVKTLKPSSKVEQVHYSSFLPPVVANTIEQLLDALTVVKPDPFAVLKDATSFSNKGDSTTTQSAAKDAAPLRSKSVIAQLLKAPLVKDWKSKEQSTSNPPSKIPAMSSSLFKIEMNKPLVTKSSILRLLAELVRSYPSCATLVATHQYKAGISSLIKQDCSALSFILDHLLIPFSKSGAKQTSAGSSPTSSTPVTEDSLPTSFAELLQYDRDVKDEPWDKDCPALARVFLACLAVSHPVTGTTGPDAHTTLVTELKSALSRAVHVPESPEKHTKLRALLDIITTIIECTSKSSNPQNRRPIGRQQIQDSTPDPTTGHIPKLMIRRGLASDLAKVPHFIDLGSSEMADTVNAALRPLEVLTRWTSLSATGAGANKPQGSEAKKNATDATSQNQMQPQAIAEETEESAANDDWPSHVATSQDNPSAGHDTLEADVEDNISDEYMEVLVGDNVSQESDLQYLDASEDQPSLVQEDVFMEPMTGHDNDGSPSDVEVVVRGTRINSTGGVDTTQIEQDEDSRSRGAVALEDISQDEDDDIADDTINGDDTSDESDHDDDQDDDDDLGDDDSGSEMDNHDGDDGYSGDLTYDTFVYDLMSGEQPENDLFIHLEDIFGGARMPRQLIPVSDIGGRRIALPVVVHGDDNRNNTDSARSIPPPPGTVTACHPLLVRHANHAQVTDSNTAPGASRSQGQSSGTGGQSAIDRWSQRVARNTITGMETSERARPDNSGHNHTIHLHYTVNRQPRSAPMVLQRLLGPSVAQNILQISNTLYNEGGGRIQLPLNPEDINHASDDIIDGLFLDSMFQYQSGLMANPTAATVPDNVPSSLARWVEESCVLDAHSLYDRMALIKDDIVEHLLKIGKKELEERKEKRKKEKAERQKEEERKKKEREEKEKEEKAQLEQSTRETAEETDQSTAPAEQTIAISTPTISTPSNTPVATRPDSPTVTTATERAPAINALQQASSSLLAVSGQLEGLSFSLQQARGQAAADEPTVSADTTATSQAAEEVVTSNANIASVITFSQQPPSNNEEQRETSPVVMDTTSPASNRSDVTMETNDVEEEVAEETTQEAVQADPEAEGSAEDAEAADAGQIMEGVDPSFLAALPADIRQEVIREQLSRSHHRAATSSSAGGTSQPVSGVSPEFLAALPPNIQEEVLEQERRERSRTTAPQVTEESLDPTTFIQTLPPDLRQSVLSDMDESLMAMLSEELAAEAQSLRGAVEDRQRRYLQERMLSHGVDLLRQSGPPRVRHRATFHGNHPSWGGFGGFSGGGLRRRPAYNAHARNGAARSNQSQPPMSRQILDHDSLACLLLLLFVEESKLNTNFLHRVFRNLCYHSPTRDWLVAALMSILQRAGETRPLSKLITDASPMDVVHSPAKLQKQFPKKLGVSWPIDKSSVGSRNRSWMSIRLEAALGSRSSIFQVEASSSATPVGKKSSSKDQSGSDASAKHVFIHPQGAPVVCRHAIDALIVLSKIFPTYFITAQALKHQKMTLDVNIEQGTRIETDFWETLMKLDVASHKKKLSSKQNNPADDDATAGKSPDPAAFDLSSTWLGVLMRMLCHPVVQRSQQLTDRMLRLLAQISRNLGSGSGLKVAGKKTNEAGGNATSPTNTTDSSVQAGNVQSEQPTDPSNPDDEEQASDSNAPTITMSARAGTSNTSTVGRSGFSSMTSTTSSSRSHGSISTVSETRVHLEKELSMAVSVLTSHACSEEGLEDATSLLLQLSKSAPALRLLIIRLLLEGAQKLGGLLARQIRTLLDEIIVYNQQQIDSGASPNPPAAPIKGSMLNRFDSTLTVVLSAKDKFKKLGRELQLPSMQALTNKTSHQAFFLRILKVIIQLQQAAKGQPITDYPGQNRTGNQFRWRVSQVEREADALMEILAPRFRNQAGRNSQSSSSIAVSPSSTALQDQETEAEKEEARLSERLQLEDLWDILGLCLKELSKSHDQHAVLVLQPAVEAFFLVHASETSQSIARRNATATEPESRESQLAHINEQPPVSPGQPSGSSSGTSASLSSQSSLVDPSMPIDTQKFLKFAETHRTVLNQILRQSTIPLSEGPFSVLVDHTRVLDFDVKRRYFRQELERTEGSSARRDDVAIRVRRDHLFEDSFRELHRRTPAELRSRLYVVFDGEDGQDAGGVLREWYLVISREIFNPMYVLFRTSPGDHGTYAINPLSYVNSNHLSYFKFVGRIVAKAIYDNKLLECYFTRSFYKHILGKPVKYTDMEAEDYEFSQGLLYLLEHDISALCTELNFSVEIEEFGKTETRDLKEGGRNLMVTEKNKREYVHLVCQEKMTGAIKKQLAAFLEGFYEIIPKRLIAIFDEQELELLISGLPNIDIDDLRQNTEYHKYQSNSLQIQWFWRALRSFDQAERAKFLQFVTGTSKVPLQGFSALEGMTGIQKFQIHRDDRSTARLPCAHTCFNQLDLPAYETYDKLRERLLLAISECTEGFGLA